MKNDKIAIMIARYIINGCDFGAVNRKPKTIILKKLEEVMFYFVKNRILPRYLDFNEITEKSNVMFSREKVKFRWDGELVFSMMMTATLSPSVLYYNSYYANVFRGVKEEELGLKLKPFIEKTGGIFNEKLEDFWEANKDDYQAVGISKELIEATISRLSPEKATHKIKEASDKLNSMTSAAKNTASAFRDFGRVASKATKGYAFILPIKEDSFQELGAGGLKLEVEPGLITETRHYFEPSELKTDIVVSKLFQLFIQGHQVKIWRILNPNRRIPGSNRTKRLRKKRNKALAEPAKKVKFSRRNSFALVDPFKG